MAVIGGVFHKKANGLKVSIVVRSISKSKMKKSFSSKHGVLVNFTKEIFMTNFSNCMHCGDELQAGDETWYAVTIHKSDGHPINGKFYTDCLEEVKDFCSEVKPLTVNVSRHPSEYEAAQFLDNFDDDYEWFDQKSYAEDYRQFVIIKAIVSKLDSENQTNNLN